MLTVMTAAKASSDPLRIVTYNAELTRDGPGLLLRDIRSGRDAQVNAVIALLKHLRPDILALQNVDHDAGFATARALQTALRKAGLPLVHLFAPAPNTGVPTGLDMNGDGRRGRADDAQGFGLFRGEGGMLLLSRFPVQTARAQDFSGLLWRDLPGARMPRVDGAPFPSAQAQAVQRLSSVGHWAVPVQTPGGPLWVLAFHATPPVFDGPEDRNGLRNADEIRFWHVYLDGVLGPAPAHRFILLGDANLDPARSEGRRAAIRALLDDPRLRALAPEGAQGTATVDWSDIGLGAMRVSYVLPSADLRVIDSGVFWPAPDDPMAQTAARASRHRALWADIQLPGTN
nr:endonuclease/exonuclease/phosphatase family protein [Lutimaribacter sp. EGI FJ00013]